MKPDDQLGHSVSLESYLRVVDPVFAHDGFDSSRRKFCKGYRIRDQDSTVLLFGDGNPWWSLVESDAETLQLVRENSQVDQRFEYVEHNENQVTRSCDGNNLSTSSFTVLLVSRCTFVGKTRRTFAPAIIPGRSRIWILAPLYSIWPGTVVKVVNS